MLSHNRRLVNIISYYTSRFLNDGTNKRVSYNNIGFKSRTETHKTVSNIFNVEQSYVKNVEDCFDSIHPEPMNHRKGWYQRDPRPAQMKIIDEFKHYNESELHKIVLDILSFKDIINYDEKEDEEEQIIRKNAAITGNKAEDLFEREISIKLQLNVKRVTDKTGLGYDFISTDNKNFYEIKGFKEDYNSFRLTKTEWKVAKAKKNQYFLILIKFVDDKRKMDHKIIQNPYKRYKDSIQKKLTNPTIYFSVSRGFI